MQLFKCLQQVYESSYGDYYYILDPIWVCGIKIMDSLISDYFKFLLKLTLAPYKAMSVLVNVGSGLVATI